MLNLIVLGQLPGTDIQVTFRGVLLAALVIYSAVGIAYHFHAIHKLAATKASQN